MEFVVKTKMHNLVIGDKKYPFRSPKQHELEDLQNQMEGSKDKVNDVYEAWYKFFDKLGLKKEVLKELDTDTFSDLTAAVINPKKD